jgi:Tol biopolymer transport system component
MRKALTALSMLVITICLTGAHSLKSGDGAWGILFYSDRNAEPGLYWMHRDGSGIEQLVRFADIHLSDQRSVIRTSLSPDAHYLAFTASAREDSSFYEFFLLDRQSKTFNELTYSTRYLKEFVWSPDSRQIAYINGTLGTSVALIDIEQGTESTIIANQKPEGIFFPIYWDVEWSPGGDQLAIAVSSDTTRVESNNILIIKTDTTDLRLLFTGNRSRLSPSWQAESSVVYYICAAPNGRLTAICAVDVERSLAVRVVDLTGYMPSDARLLTIDTNADGRILFMYDANSIYVYDSGVVTTLIENLIENTFIYDKPCWFYREDS